MATSRLTAAGPNKGFGSMAKSARGSLTIEKVFMIALFVFVAAVGLQIFGRAARFAMLMQALEISRYTGKL